ncbi:DUF4913 domain-containing protein [Streptomyces sp. NPDC059371]|uniref:DUF4913 domain-containing protein n=1 Tax=Streptomyces sp. NPDC059371 TaxID=3346812 RepID=UPI0036897287
MSGNAMPAGLPEGDERGRDIHHPHETVPVTAAPATDSTPQPAPSPLTSPFILAGLSGPSVWHRDHLTHVMATLRAPAGPFAGCKAGHRDKEAPPMAAYPDQTRGPVPQPG